MLLGLQREKNDTDGKAASYLHDLFSSHPCVRDLVCQLAFVRLPDLECFWDPEYHAAAKVVLMTTSTGTRSATALFEALIVRRIPFPACTKHCRLFPVIIKQTQNASTPIKICGVHTHSYEYSTRPVEIINPTLLKNQK